MKKSKKKKYLNIGCLVIYIVLIIIYIVSISIHTNHGINQMISDYFIENIDLEISQVDTIISNRINRIENVKEYLKKNENINQYYENLGFKSVEVIKDDSIVKDNLDIIPLESGISYLYKIEEGYQISLIEGKWFNEQLILNMQDGMYVSLNINNINYTNISNEEIYNCYNLKEKGNYYFSRLQSKYKYFSYEKLDIQYGFMVTLIMREDIVSKKISTTVDNNTLYILAALIPSMIIISFWIRKIIKENIQDKKNSSIELNDLNWIFKDFREALIIYDFSFKKALFITDNIEKITGMNKKEIFESKDFYDIFNNNITKKIYNLLIEGQEEVASLSYTIFNKYLNKNVYLNIKVNSILYYKKKCFAITLMDVTNEHLELEKAHLEVKNAMDSSNQKTEFLSRVSHEIRTPLNAIIGMNEIALDSISSNETSKAMEALNCLKESSNYLLQIINNVLDISKIEHGKTEVKRDVFKLDEVITSTLNIINPLCEKKNITLNKLFKYESLYIVSDKVYLTQILINILSNSVKYTKMDGFINFNIQMNKIKDEKVKLDFLITDNGIGMKEEFLKHIFEPFSRENRTDSYQIGTGLGLTITKNLIELLNGKIEVSSEEGMGTSFKISFVFDESKKPLVEINQNIVDDFSNIHVLVVEDNPINLLICKNYLKKYNFKIDSASDGLEAFNKFNESKLNTYDLILMDIQMPNLDGFGATKKIRELNRLDNDVIIIAMTADAFMEDVNKALMNQMDDHIAKPLEQNKMMDVIKKHLKRHHKI